MAFFSHFFWFPCAYIPSKKPNVSLDMNFIKRCVLYALHEENEGKEKDKKERNKGKCSFRFFFQEMAPPY